MARYKAIGPHAEIDTEVALLQTAACLDAAAIVAERMNDVEGLMNVAAMWMRYGEALTNFTEYAEQQDAARKQIVYQSPKLSTGFQRSDQHDPNIFTEGEKSDD